MSQKTSLHLTVTCFVLFTLILPCISRPKGAKISGMFVFGSSLVDNGNNNFLENSMARVDYFPYGIDFPLGQSGRFTNGKNVVDILGEKLSIPDYIPPFTNPSTTGRRIVNGVNFASGGSGILDDTGSLAGNVTSLNQQIRNFEEVTLPELNRQVGNTSKGPLARFLFVVGSGGNDYSLNYFLRLASRNVTIQDFTDGLVASLSGQLKRLHESGARKFVLMSINPNGCSPMATARAPTQEGCVEPLNRAAEIFNSRLRELVDVIRPHMPGSHLAVVDAYRIITDIIRYPSLKGFVDARNPCCEVSAISEGGTGVLCKRGGSICQNRRRYVFFDGLHPTEAVNNIIAAKAFGSKSKAEVYPFNVRKLSQI